MVSACRPARSSCRARQRRSSSAFSAAKEAASGAGVMKLDRANLTSPSTLPLSLPLPGRPKRSRNRWWLTSSVKARVRSRRPSPQILATAILVLSYRIDSGTPPKKAKAATCPSRNASVVSRGYALTKQASECGRSMQKKWILHRVPPIVATASPKSTWAWPGGWASGTKVSRPRARPIRTWSFTTV